MPFTKQFHVNAPGKISLKSNSTGHFGPRITDRDGISKVISMSSQTAHIRKLKVSMMKMISQRTIEKDLIIHLKWILTWN